MMEDNLVRLEYGGHIWEFGYFGAKRNGYSAYGFRQDGTIIRVTSKYEAELIAKLFQQGGGNDGNCIQGSKGR